MKLSQTGNLHKPEYLAWTSTLEAQEGKVWIAPSEILQSLTDTVLLKRIWLGSVLLINWVNHWAEEKDKVLRTDSEVKDITRNIVFCLKR